jgi:murein DD-endopeptidase MepM/ murein hydrolase activator NlpD
MKAIKSRYLVKIVPPVGYRVWRLEFSRRHIAVALAALTIALGAAGGYYVWTIRHAEMRVGELRSLTEDQSDKLQKIDAQAAELDGELRALEKQNDEIRKMFGSNPKAAGVSSTGPVKDGPESYDPNAADGAFAAVEARVERLRADSRRVRADGDRLRGLAMRVLNVHRLEDLARARVLAAIPSINPAGDVAISAPFGWRVIPWPEFHQGVDLAADYGTSVMASAAGTVVTAQYDGGYGNRIDIDHGNGYHTWYCHLERIDVKPGQFVHKAEHIALSGSTGESTGPHLHYQVMLDGKAIDPAPYLNGVPDKVLASLK